MYLCTNGTDTATRTLVLQEQIKQQQEAGYGSIATDESVLFSSAVAGGITGSIWTAALRKYSIYIH
jgi:hypothetical protein